MELSEIITAAVEKRVAELVEHAITDRGSEDYPHQTSIEGAVATEVTRIARDEVLKHEDAIRKAIIATLEATPSRVEISAYSKINFPATGTKGD